MAANSFGNLFRITTFGESHGKSIGVVIDGCPAGLKITDNEINSELSLRAPGKSPYTTPRRESDCAEIISGIFAGETTGAPLCIQICNNDSDASKYLPIKEVLRPGHANYTYLHKYGIFDYRGGGRASARETACRVAAGAVAKRILEREGILICAYIIKIGNIVAQIDSSDLSTLRTMTYNDPLYCPDQLSSRKMAGSLAHCIDRGDSLGGVVEFIASPMIAGLGDPVYEKLEARLAYAMMGIPAAKGFEIGTGFKAAEMKGSDHNDLFERSENGVCTKTNHAGGVLGGISSGMPLVGRIAFKPTSSIKIPQESVNILGEEVSFRLPEGSRHDPCVAIRAVPVVEAMAALTLADALLYNRSCRL